MTFALLSLTVLLALQGAASLPAGSSPQGSKKAVASAYYTSWHAPERPLSRVCWDEYNVLIYAFVATSPDASGISLTSTDKSLLPEFVKEAHEHNVAAHASIGGWTQSGYFSSNVATKENRTAFVKTVVDLAKEYQLDGINFDWEYPAKQGIGCNIVSSNDTENFLAFLQELRKDPVGANMTLSAAVSIAPFVDSTGGPSKDVSGFADVLDYVSVMDYDIYGPWSPAVGPNAPLNDLCAPIADQVGSAVSAIKAWSAAKMPLNQIVLGVASYGHSFRVSRSDAFEQGSKTQLALYPKFNSSNPAPGGSWDNTSSVDVCGVFEPAGATYELFDLVDDGFLDKEGKPAPGIHYRFDNCSQTPFVYNEASEIMISYDNAQSFEAKGKFIYESGLRGFALWEAGGDYHDILVRSIRKAVGYT